MLCFAPALPVLCRFVRIFPVVPGFRALFALVPGLLPSCELPVCAGVVGPGFPFAPARGTPPRIIAAVLPGGETLRDTQSQK